MTLNQYHPGLYRDWLLTMGSTVVFNVIAWTGVAQTGDTFPGMVALAILGAAIGWVVVDAGTMWQRRVVEMLYFQDIGDGVCPDRGAEITYDNAWRWYRQQGSPWRLNPQRERPPGWAAHALDRLSGFNPNRYHAT
jgi:hypothetical protein